jgi:hypothetical protein
MNQPPSYATDDLYREIDKKRKAYDRRGASQEYIYWIGAGLSSVCSAVAGLSIVSNLGTASLTGRILTGTLAVVPAVWTGIISATKLKELSVFNYSMETKLHIMLMELRKNPGSFEETYQAYQVFLKEEQDAFEAFMLGLGKRSS